MMPTMSEDDCAICAKWPPALRATMRQAIERVTMKGWVCDDCVIAFWENIWADAMSRRKKAKNGRRQP
jgi:hypothetical protein